MQGAGGVQDGLASNWSWPPLLFPSPPTHVRPSPPLVRCGGGLVPQEQLTGIMFQDVGGGSGLDFCLAEVEIV